MHIGANALMNSNSNLCTKSQTQLQNQYGPIVPEKVANQTRVQPTCIIGIKKGGTKVFTSGKSRLSRFLSKFGPKLLSDFYDMTVNRQFSSKKMN